MEGYEHIFPLLVGFVSSWITQQAKKMNWKWLEQPMFKFLVVGVLCGVGSLIIGWLTLETLNVQELLKMGALAGISAFFGNAARKQKQKNGGKK